VLPTGGQPGDNPQLLPVLDAIAVPGSWRRPAAQAPGLLLVDKGYTRAALRRQRIRHAIPPAL
jgi:hypothetical protein